MGPVFVVARPKSGCDIGAGAGIAGQIGFLRQIPDRCPRLGEPRAGIGLRQPGGDLQQGGFARAVAPDQADAVPGRDPEFRPRQQRRGAESQGNIFE